MFIEHLEISNFKSIQHLELDGFKKINLLIGRPNVGKSNILEALGLFTVPYLKYSKNPNLKDLIRLEQFSELFFDGEVNNPIEVTAKLTENTSDPFERILTGFGLSCKVKSTESSLEIELPNYNINIDKALDLSIKTIGEDPFDEIKMYQFKNNISFSKSTKSSLLPPFGDNLLWILEDNHELKDTISKMFSTYNLKLVFDKASQSLKVLKGLDNDNIFLLPYNSIADTLRRIIFYKTAIATNKDSVLLFEEPEAHAFPPYIAYITQEAIQSESNQFIIATHSPIVVNDFLENAIDDLAIFMVDYKDNQTVVKRLSDEELKNIAKYGVDIFTNYEMYL